ncbi:MAG: endonuclease VIII [Burkholderiales bacterium]|nr:endonuclease VIII [Burkholderiales bacterium]
MPEGPEIRRAADKLKRVLEGQKALSVRFAKDRFPTLQASSRRLAGRMIEAVEPRGKAILTRFAGGLTIYSHNQLYGEWVIYRGEAPASHLQTRLAIRTAKHSAILYSASEIEVLKTALVHRHPYIAKLGVELLDPDVSEVDVLAQVCAPRFARRNLAGLLLDQGFLAGIGNYLRSDILFAARLHPAARPADLTPAQRETLARVALRMTRQSYRTRGITNNPRLARRLKARGMAFSEYRHWVFDRAGAPCHTCGQTIVRIDFGSRGLYLCERCQPGPR